MNIQSFWLKVTEFHKFWEQLFERRATLGVPVPLSGAAENACEQALLTPSLEGEYERCAEVRRQQLAVGLLPELGMFYFSALNRHSLENPERLEVDNFVDDEIRQQRKERKVNARDLGIQERTARVVYQDDDGIPLVGYAPEFYLGIRLPAPTVYLLQTYMHARDLAGLPIIAHFGEVPIRGVEDLRGLLETRETLMTITRTQEATGNYPSLEEMGILLAHETVCKDQIIRAKTTTEHLGYDEHHADDSLQTVEKHNAFVGLLKSVTVQQAQIASDEGDMVLWNAGETGKHFIVSCDQEAV